MRCFLGRRPPRQELLYVSLLQIRFDALDPCWKAPPTFLLLFTTTKRVLQSSALDPPQRETRASALPLETALVPEVRCSAKLFRGTSSTFSLKPS